MNAVAAVAITLGKAQQPEYKQYCRQVLDNAQVLARALMENGAKLITDGTENHMMVIDTVKSFGINGRVAEETLDEVSITTNKQVIPDDPNPPLRPSGIRLGTPAAGDTRHERTGNEASGPVDHQGPQKPRGQRPADVRSRRSGRAVFSASGTGDYVRSGFATQYLVL